MPTQPALDLRDNADMIDVRVHGDVVSVLVRVPPALVLVVGEGWAHWRYGAGEIDVVVGQA